MVLIAPAPPRPTVDDDAAQRRCPAPPRPTVVDDAAQRRSHVYDSRESISDALQRGLTYRPLAVGLREQVITESPTSTVSGSGFTINTSAGLDAVARAETVLVPGYEDIDGTVSMIVLATLQAAHARGARLISICTGAFALAAAGILDGRPATTHWRWADDLQRRYPRVNVVPNRLFVDDGDVLTSAGVTTGIDLCLHIIRRDHGAAAANSRARALVAPPQRQGGQAQFVERFARRRAATNSPRFATGCWKTLPSRSTSTRSPGTHTCPGERSPAGFAKRPECRRWRGSPMRASTADASCWRSLPNLWRTSAA